MYLTAKNGRPDTFFNENSMSERGQYKKEYNYSNSISLIEVPEQIESKNLWFIPLCVPDCLKDKRLGNSQVLAHGVIEKALFRGSWFYQP